MVKGRKINRSLHYEGITCIRVWHLGMFCIFFCITTFIKMCSNDLSFCFVDFVVVAVFSNAYITIEACLSSSTHSTNSSWSSVELDFARCPHLTTTKFLGLRGMLLKAMSKKRKPVLTFTLVSAAYKYMCRSVIDCYCCTC